MLASPRLRPVLAVMRKTLAVTCLKLETLEKRELFNVDMPAFQNGLISHDVDLTNSVGPLDVLAIVNKLNDKGGSTYLGNQPSETVTHFVDVDGDDI